MSIRFNTIQLKQLAEINASLGVVFFTSIITPLFSTVDKANFLMIMLGLILGASFITMSLFILKGANDYES